MVRSFDEAKGRYTLSVAPAGADRRHVALKPEHLTIAAVGVPAPATAKRTAAEAENDGGQQRPKAPKLGGTSGTEGVA